MDILIRYWTENNNDLLFGRATAENFKYLFMSLQEDDVLSCLPWNRFVNVLMTSEISTKPFSGYYSGTEEFWKVGSTTVVCLYHPLCAQWMSLRNPCLCATMRAACLRPARLVKIQGLMLNHVASGI